MKILVLGATGFIGGRIALNALHAGWHVRCLRRNPTATGILTGYPVEWVPGDLTQREDLNAAFREVDVVFHAAAFYPKRNDTRSLSEQIGYAKNEIDNIIEAACNVKLKKLIYTSSLSTIGFPPDGSDRWVNEDDFYHPGNLKHSAYYEAKYVMEQKLLTAAAHGLPVVILNPTAVFGPGDVHLTTGKILIALARGKGIAWVPGTVNIIDVRDVANAHIRAVEHGIVGQRYILAGHNMSIKKAIQVVADITGNPQPRFEIPGGAIRFLIQLDDILPKLNLTGNHLRAVLKWRGFDNTKSRKTLNLAPRPFVETIRDSINWFKIHGYLE